MEDIFNNPDGITDLMKQNPWIKQVLFIFAIIVVPYIVSIIRGTKAVDKKKINVNRPIDKNSSDLHEYFYTNKKIE